MIRIRIFCKRLKRLFYPQMHLKPSSLHICQRFLTSKKVTIRQSPPLLYNHLKNNGRQIRTCKGEQGGYPSDSHCNFK